MKQLILLFFAGTFVASIPSFAQSNEGSEVYSCLLHNAVLLEPHQDNMFDLARIIVETQCIQQRDKFLASNGVDTPEGIYAYKQKMLSEVQAMVVAARSKRLGLERK
ncbi:hypothetical protein [Profundibacter sp.]